MSFHIQNPGSVELPLQIQHLYKWSVTDLTAEEAGQLSDLLLEFSDVFTEGSHDLGQTDLVKHRINKDGAAPIRQTTAG